MRYKNIITFFCVALPVCVVMRFLQILFVTDSNTGFVKFGESSTNFKIIMVILIAILVTGFLSFSAHRCPTAPPKVNPVLGVSAFIMAIGIAYELASESFITEIYAWQIILLEVTGLLTAVYFVAYSLKTFFNYPLPSIFAAIPSIYFIFRIICIFTAISSLSLIMDNVMILASYCSALLFFLSFGKLLNNLDTEHNFKKLLASGLCASIICLSDSIPRLIIGISGNSRSLHSSAASTFTVFLIGVFILIFTLSHFSNSNLKKKKHKHRHHLDKERTDESNYQYYTDPGMPKEKPYKY